MGIIKRIDEVIEMADQQPKMNMIWKGIKEGTFNIIAAPAKTGKTTLCENLGMSIAAGQIKYLNSPIWYGDNQLVMMISLEEFYLNRTERNKKQLQFADELAGNADWHDNFMVADNDVPRYFQDKKNWEWLQDEIKEVNPRLVCLDSMTRLHPGESIEDSTVCLELTRKLRTLVDVTGVTLIAIHHTSKMTSELLSLSSMAGSRIIAQEADAVIGLNKTPSGVRYLKPLAYRYADDNVEKVQTFTINSNSWLELQEEVYENKLLREFDNRTNDDNKEELSEYIMEFTGGDNSIIIETSILTQNLVNSGIMTKPTLHKHLKALVEEGFIKKQKQGQYTLPQPKVEKA